MRKKPKNVFNLVLQRETNAGRVGRRHHRAGGDSSNKELQQWLEDDFLKCCSAQYCDLSVNSRSTIAAAFSHDGSLLASTHGDHTVKIICTFTGKCVKVLKGHKRTPWVVRFHPTQARLLASGSLDSEVRIWDVRTGACLDCYDFSRPIASLAFSCDGKQLAVAAGHKLFIWAYTADAAPSSDPNATPPQPIAILKTRRSLRAVQFHSLGTGLILTAELHEANLLFDPLPTPTIDLQGPPARPPTQPTPLDGAWGTPAAPASTGSLLQYRHQYQQTGASTSHAFASTDTHALHPSQGCASTGGQPYARPSCPDAPAQHGSHRATSNDQSSERAARGGLASTSTQAAPAPGGLRSALSHSLSTRRPSPDPPSAPLSDPSPLPTRYAPTPEFTNLSLSSTPSAPCPPSSSTPLPLPAAPLHRRNRSDSSPPPQPTSPSPPLPVRPPYSIRGADASTAHPRHTTRPTTIPSPRRQTTAAPPAPATAAAPAALPHAPLPALYRPWFTSSPTQPTHLPPPRALHPHHDTVHTVQISSSPHNLHTSWAIGSSPPVQHPTPFFHIPTRSTPTPCDPHPAPASPSRAPLNPPRPHPQPDLTRLHPPPLHPNPRPGAAPYPQAAPYLSSSLPLAHPLIPLGCNFPWPWEVHSDPPDPPHPHPASPPSTPPAATLMLQQDQPSISKLRLFRLDPAAPRRLTDPPLLSISHAVLCSEMGTHLSPCGRYLAAVVACSPSPRPTRRAPRTPAHPDPPLVRNILYELRVYSLAPPTFGAVLRSRPIKAAQCLTSLQFSPTSSHLLLAYGRRHLSLCSLVADGHSVTPVHTVLDIYRLSDMALARVLPSAEDEVNVAAFHPVAGEGVAYGTKEGRLRILRHDRVPPAAPRGGGAGGGKRMGLELEEEEDGYTSSEEGEEEEGGAAGGRGAGGLGALGGTGGDSEVEEQLGGAGLLWGL